MCAKVINPLLSMDASGTVGKALTFGKWKGRNTVRKYFIPADPKSELQTNIRSAVSKSSKYFKGLSETDQESWNSYASDQNNTGIAIFMKYAIDDYMDQLGTSAEPDTLSVSDEDDPTIAAFTWTEVV